MVGVIASDVDGTGIRIASDLSRAFDSGTDLRIMPIVGRGSVQNINDLLTLKAVDVAIVQSDVLARFLKTGKQSSVQSRMQYVAKLYSEEFHLLSRMQFVCIQDLAGRRVGFGPKDSGMAVTAEAVFEAYGVAVDALYLDHDEAIDRLKRGEIDALVYVGGKPSRAFDRITHKDKVHFLDVDYLPGLQAAAYLPAIIVSEDYPNLVASNESVATIGVSTVMVIHNWPQQSERFRVMTRFTERFLAGIERLKTGNYSPKWREVNVRAPVKGWQRFQPAERWLLANAQASVSPSTQAAQQLKTMLQKFVESQRGNTADQEELFNQFVRWYQQQSAPSAQQQ